MKVVLLTLYDSFEYVRTAFQAGARGYLLKSDTETEMMRALKTVASNGIYASSRLDQGQVAKLLSELGLNNGPVLRTNPVLRTKSIADAGNVAAAPAISPSD